MISEKIINRLNNEASWYDVFSQSGTSLSIDFKNNELEMIEQSELSGTGLRLNKNGKTGFSFTNDPLQIDGVVDKAIALSEFGDKENFSLPQKVPYPEVLCSYKENFDKDSEVEFGKSAIEKIKKEFPSADVDVRIGYGNGSRTLINSSGINKTEDYSSYYGYVSAVLVDDEGSRLETGYGLSSTADISFENLPDKVINDFKLAVKRDNLQSGKLPIIFTPKAFRSMLSIILSGFNAVSHYKQISPFCGKIGKKLFSETLSVIDNPLIENSLYSYAFDDEGVPAREKYIIKEGVVEEIISDVKYASLLKMNPSGNSSRGYSSLPGASFSNIIVPSGDQSKDSIVGDIKEGILVDQFLGLGQSNTITGDFSANLELAYAVKNGEITGRIKDCMVSDNIYNMLKQNLVFSKEKSNVGNSLLPYVLFEKINFTS